MRFVFLLFLACAPIALAQSCSIQCMERSGCWSGRTTGCNNMQELCDIQCRGKDGDGWAAIAYSKPDKIWGSSFAQAGKDTAAQVAMQYCRGKGGAACVIEANFSHACGAVAADGAIVAWGTAAAKPAAQQRAMAECAKSGGKKCVVEASVCSAAAAGGNRSSAPTAPPPPKATSWGAIAYSSADMGAGYSQGKADRSSAEKEALSVCAQRGKSCVLQTAFNKECGALAADGNFVGVATSPDQRAALQKALDECRKAGGSRCAPHISFCSN